MRFVLPDVGEPLEWIASDRIFTVWKGELAKRILDPAQESLDLDGMESGYGYLASEWRSVSGETIILFERHH